MIATFTFSIYVVMRAMDFAQNCDKKDAHTPFAGTPRTIIWLQFAMRALACWFTIYAWAISGNEWKWDGREMGNNLLSISIKF
jgi:hypothetical protein